MASVCLYQSRTRRFSLSPVGRVGYSGRGYLVAFGGGFDEGTSRIEKADLSVCRTSEDVLG
jgi:hypothetical protein